MDPTRTNIGSRRALLVTVLAFPIIAGGVTWSITDGWLGPGAAYVRGAEPGGSAVSDSGTANLAGDTGPAVQPILPAPPAVAGGAPTGPAAAPTPDDGGAPEPVPAAPGTGAANGADGASGPEDADGTASSSTDDADGGADGGANDDGGGPGSDDGGGADGGAGRWRVRRGRRG